MTIQFLDANEMRMQVVKLLQDTNEFFFAVAYWGRGSMQQLGLDKLCKKQSGTIICDLMSGACNPDEIEKLINLKNSKLNILKCEGLHAKVYWTQNTVIVGSSNVSSNGLCYEGQEVAGLVEGNLKTDDQTVNDRIGTWLRSLITSSITDEDIKKAKVIWLKSRGNRQIKLLNGSFSQTLKQKNGFEYLLNKKIRIWVYENSNHSVVASKTLKKAQAEKPNLKFDAYEHDLDEQDVDSGTIIIDQPYNKTKNKYRLLGPSLCQVLPGNHTLFSYDKKTKKKFSKLLLCEPIQSIDDVTMTKRDLNEIKNLTKSYLESRFSDGKISECEIPIEELLV
jgi:HKD family nuclease